MKYFKFSIFILTLIFIALSAIGCGESDRDTGTPIAVVILIGNHANSQCLDVQLDTTVNQIYSSFGNIGIIVIDGNPTLVRDTGSTGILGCYSAEYLKPLKKLFYDNNQLWLNKYLAPQTQKIINELNACKADDPEVDILQSLHIAAESLNTIENFMETGAEKEIIILDTGINTCGAMTFLSPEYQTLLSYQGKLWEEDTMISKVSELIQHLDEQAEIPNLKGIHITWYGLGQVSEPQPALSKLGLQNLQYIWGELLSKANACPSTKENADEKYGIFISTSTHGTIESDQYVTPISWNIPSVAEVPERPDLPEAKVSFKANSENYLSPGEEEEILKSYASILQNYPNEKILLIGSTSSYNGGSLELSEKRAMHVKRTLISFGIPEDCISIIGLGYDLLVCQEDSPNNHFEESIAQKNRSVLILPYDSPKAQDILAARDE